MRSSLQGRGALASSIPMRGAKVLQDNQKKLGRSVQSANLRKKTPAAVLCSLVEKSHCSCFAEPWPGLTGYEPKLARLWVQL